MTTTSRSTSAATSTTTMTTTSEEACTAEFFRGSSGSSSKPRFLSVERRMQGRTDMIWPYWVLRQSECVGMFRYSVAPCRLEQCDPSTHSKDREFITAKVLYPFNSYRDETNFTNLSKKTRTKLTDAGHNLISFDPRDFDRERAKADYLTQHWITFHVCRFLEDGSRSPAVTRVIKIGTSDTPRIGNTLKSEVQRVAGKSYYWCEPDSIRIYLFKGASNKVRNDWIETCLRYRYMPSSEEEDVTESKGKSACRNVCKNKDTHSISTRICSS